MKKIMRLRSNPTTTVMVDFDTKLAGSEAYFCKVVSTENMEKYGNEAYSDGWMCYYQELDNLMEV